MSHVPAYRIYKSVHASTAMTGFGAARYGGRWNHRGTAIVYCSSSLSLAQLEQLVHLCGPLPPGGFEWRELRIPKRSFDQRVCLTVKQLSEFGFDWRADPPHLALQEIGTDWVDSNRSLILEVPSVVNPAEFNYLINPAHPEFTRIRWQPATRLEFDPRLLSQ